MLPVLRLKGPKIVLVDDDVAVLIEKVGWIGGPGHRRRKRSLRSEEVLDAVDRALFEAGRKQRCRLAMLASAWIKSEEEDGMKPGR